MSALVDLRDVFVVRPSEDGGVAALRGLTLGVERSEMTGAEAPVGTASSPPRWKRPSSPGSASPRLLTRK